MSSEDVLEARRHMHERLCRALLLEDETRAAHAGFHAAVAQHYAQWQAATAAVELARVRRFGAAVAAQMERGTYCYAHAYQAAL